MGRNGRDGARLGATVVTAVALALAACGRATTPTAAGQVAPAASDAGFVAPPTLLQAEQAPGGGVRLSGRAPPDATVRLQAPDGRAVGVTSDAAGAWALDLPASATPALYAVSADLAGRTLHGEGAVAVAAPGAGALALTARAGAPAAVAVSGPPPAAPSLQVVDFDDGGGIAAAGRAAPGATLKLAVDGAVVVSAAADGAGRFALPGLGSPLSRGLHRIRVDGSAGAAEATVDTSAAAPLGDAPFRALRLADGWRVDWAPPGGGVQSFVWLDAPARPAPGAAPGPVVAPARAAR